MIATAQLASYRWRPVIFWLITLGISVLTALLLIRPFVKPPEVDADANAGLEVLKGQLAALEEDVATGKLTGQDASRARVELKRRILQEHQRAETRPITRESEKHRIWMIRVVGLAVVLGLGLYVILGAPELA